MKYLLDTVAWLWSVHADEHLGQNAREILENGAQDIYLSAASTWELSIKMRLGKLNFPGHRRGLCRLSWPSRVSSRWP